MSALFFLDIQILFSDHSEVKPKFTQLVFFVVP